jgi:hypothetical protein
MPMLFVSCRNCETPFPSGIAHDQEVVGHVTMFNILERCPKCGAVDGFSTADFFFETPTPPVEEEVGEATVDGPAAAAPAPDAAVAEAGEPTGEKHTARVLGSTQV